MARRRRFRSFRFFQRDLGHPVFRELEAAIGGTVLPVGNGRPEGGDAHRTKATIQGKKDFCGIGN